jgi:hypothetical protein
MEAILGFCLNIIFRGTFMRLIDKKSPLFSEPPCILKKPNFYINFKKFRHYSVNACLTPVCSVFGKAVTTVEGIGSVAKKRLHPIQERLSV